MTQQVFLQRLEEQRTITELHNKALHEASAASLSQRKDLDEILRRRVSARWPMFAGPEVVQQTVRSSIPSMAPTQPAVPTQPPAVPIPLESAMPPPLPPSPQLDARMRTPSEQSWPGPIPQGVLDSKPQYDHYTTHPSVAIGFTEVPKAPKYNGTTKLAMRKFMDEYQAYTREVALLNMACGTAKVGLMSLAACIDPRAVERICYWNIQKPYHETTEEHWRNFFALARATE